MLACDVPIIQAPMAGAQDSALAIAVCQAGGLGFLPCAMISVEKAREEIATIRRGTDRPFGLNFFCHVPPDPDPEIEARWRELLSPYYVELGLQLPALSTSTRQPFDDAACELVEEVKPAVVSFHFGLPNESLLTRIRATGAKILSSATTVAEAQWLERQGCDAIIAQGAEAGGHQGMFLSRDVATHVGTFALVPQIVDQVSVPVIATGGIADARGVDAARALGASAVQVGTAYLFCPEARISDVHRQALLDSKDDSTALTNIFSGRLARGIVNRLMREIGPISDVAPPFPLASGLIAPLRATSENRGSPDFAQMWSGQAASLCSPTTAAELTRELTLLAKL